MLVLSFPKGLIRPRNRPRIRPSSLGNVNLYFSSHRGKKNFSELLNALFGDWVPLIRMQCPGDMSGNPFLLSAQLQPTVKVLRLFGLPLIDCSYMCTVSEHTTAFSITGPAASRFFFKINHRQAASAPVKHSETCQLLFRVGPLSYSALFCSIFSLRIVY